MEITSAGQSSRDIAVGRPVGKYRTREGLNSPDAATRFAYLSDANVERIIRIGRSHTNESSAALRLHAALPDGAAGQRRPADTRGAFEPRTAVAVHPTTASVWMAAARKPDLSVAALNEMAFSLLGGATRIVVGVADIPEL